MKIVHPSAEVFFHYPVFVGSDNEGSESFELSEFIEKVGRTCYRSEEKIVPGSDKKFVKMITDRNHGAMLEHVVASCLFTCDRGVSHELVRHRLASFAQESTRYCNYSKDKFDGEISVIRPFGMSEFECRQWEAAVEACEKAYLAMINEGKCSPQIARSVLPTCLATKIWITANIREWMHIFSLRISLSAHPQMREIMCMALPFFIREMPELFRQYDAGDMMHEGVNETT
jgi:thymidylate synthase (FAD)